MDTFSIILNHVRTDFKELNQIFENENYEEICEALTQHKIGTYAAHFGKDNLSSEQLQILKQKYAPAFQQFARVQDIIIELERIAGEAGIDFAIIKGIGLNTQIYGSNHVRTFGDLDILVRKEDALELNHALNNSGFFQKIGPTSTSTATNNYARAFVAAHAKGVHRTYTALPFPIKAQRNKPEYLPYVRKDMPNIEMHDGLYFLSEESVDAMREGTVRITSELGNFTTLNPEHTFILLLINTFENSESFYSNTYDFNLTLRDYIDLRFFFEKYKNDLHWAKITTMIHAFEISHIAGSVIGNLAKIYGRDVTCGCLPSIPPLESEWGMSILERMRDTDRSRKAALHVMRERWLAEGEKSHIQVYKAENQILLEKFHRCAHITNVFFNIEYISDSFVLTWAISSELEKEKGDLLYQFTFFPLQDQIKYTSYKVDISYYDGECKSYGHSTKRYRLDAIKKETNISFPVTSFFYENMLIFQTIFPFHELGILLPLPKQSLCVSVDIYRKQIGDIYYQINGTKSIPGISLLEMKE